MSSQEITEQNVTFYKEIENDINERAQFIGFFSLQLETLAENITQSILNVASIIDAGFLLKLQEMKVKVKGFSEKMKSLNMDRVDEIELSLQPYQSPVDHSEVAGLVNEIESIIKSANDVKSIIETTN